MISYIPGPSSSSPLDAIQGSFAYGNGNPATTTTITYNFGYKAGTQFWNHAYRDDFRAALSAIEAVANIRFVETSNSATADLVEYIAPGSFFSSNNTLGYHYTPSSLPSEGAFNTDFWVAGENGDPGGFFFTTILHELGHALGLGHPHDTGLSTGVMQGVTSPFDSFGTGNLNQGVFTVMSYNDGWTSRDGILPVSATYGGSTGLGALDIAALQAMYGANTSANSGSNIYTLPSSNSAGVGYQAIWDTGGIDALRHAGSQNAVLDLRPATLDYSVLGGGGVSFVGGVKGGYTIAAGAIIENASGGSGDDTILGNGAENTIWGHLGNDTIYSASNGSNNNNLLGGHGHDAIHLADGVGADTVHGEAGNDTAFVKTNSGSFFGGAGFDTVSFAASTKGYLFSIIGGNYSFFNVIARVGFTVGTDVERFQFASGAQQFDLAGLTSAMSVRDIELTGTALQHAAQGIYLLNGAESNIAVTYRGAAVGETTFSGWRAIQAEAGNIGLYQILWEHNNGQYSEWTVNSSGQYLWQHDVDNVVDREIFYQTDLNNDGTIGHKTTTIESDGSTSLGSSTTGYYRLDDRLTLLLKGDGIGPDSYADWKAIQAEADGDDFRVLWKNLNGQYAEWTVSRFGGHTGNSNIDNVVDVEVFYSADLNNDGTIGHKTTAIESDGSTSLASSTHGYYLLNNSVELSLNGNDIGADSYADWKAIHAEAEGEGFRVLWKNPNGQYSEWTVNGDGEHTGNTAIENVVDVESFYGVDLNADGTIGHITTVIETNGATSLAGSPTHGHYILDGSVTLSLNGNVIGPDSYPDWQAIHAEASGEGYRVLWKHTDGRYSEWTVDGEGAFQGSEDIADVIDVESFYGYDINGSGTIGYEEPKLTQSVSDRQVQNPQEIDLAESDEFEFRSIVPDLSAAGDSADAYDYALLSSGNSDEGEPIHKQGAESPENIVLDVINLLEDDVFSL
ncbi:M10 family metallopeptidase C-terminal domain-containing protein [Ruegeria atlantica]|uniref:M10 family metallopeptidase C-terminal domain-containing protein n=1 Tax=Ruegeria atlantica TaxID=81569 RepID=UPI002494E63A|nr:M10 family metallopeptidase C-terminal domain-containing protein [Ruegeria atlantica]